MKEESPLAAAVARACREGTLLRPGDRVLVAASGGGDSTALAVLLGEASAHGLSLDLVLGHVDHGWRGRAEAARDRDAVEALGRRLDVLVHVSPAPPRPVRSEDAARRWRYHQLDRMAQEAGCLKVATGHHLRDQAETVWMRLERGSGRVGLQGIPPRRPLGEGGVEVVRPLLGVHPARLRDLLEARGIPWRDDPTNLELHRDRARARARLVALEQRGGAASRRLAAFADRLRVRARRREAALARRLAAETRVHPVARAVEADRGLLRSFSAAELDLALRLLGRRIGADRDGPFFTRRHLVRIRQHLEEGGALDLPRDLRFSVGRTRAWLRPRTPPESPTPPPLGRQDLDRADFDLETFLAERLVGIVALDADVLGSEAHLRFPRPGDRLTPFGDPSDRERDLLDWLEKQRVPGWLRPLTPILVGTRGVAWVPGRRIDRAHAITPETRRVAVVRTLP